MHCEHRVHRSAPNFHVPGGSHVLGVPPCCRGGGGGTAGVAARAYEWWQLGFYMLVPGHNYYLDSDESNENGLSYVVLSEYS